MEEEIAQLKAQIIKLTTKNKPGRPVGANIKWSKPRYNVQKKINGVFTDLGDFIRLQDIADELNMTYNQVRHVQRGNTKLAKRLIITKL